MSLQDAKRAIDQKASALATAGLELGAPSGAVVAAHSGGFVRAFAAAHIFWHPNTGAHEVHGSIRTAYLERGGPGPNPATGQRELGYPTGDEGKTDLGTPFGPFEFGVIHAVPGAGNVTVHGPIARAVDPLRLGLPLTGPITAAGATTVLCERGCLIGFGDTGPSTLLSGVLDLPGIGRPALIGLKASRRRTIDLEFRTDGATWDRILAKQTGPAAGRLQQAQTRLASIFKDRLVVRGVANPRLTQAMQLSTKTFEDEATGLGGIRLVKIVFEGHVDPAVTLPDRTLWDVCLRLPDGRLHAIAPHGIYSHGNWEDFGFLHATDLHVSRRLDGFRAKLKAAGRAPAARLMVNCNDSVRALFNYANALHDQGLIDCIVATGDLVDYIYERGDDHRRGGNFRYLERLILGEAPSPDPEGDENQELRVPIFTVLGNHDYVVNPYELFFEIDIRFQDDPVIRKYASFNLTETDARALQDGHMPTVSTDAAKKMIESLSAADPYYARRINDARSYVVNLGDHRLVMLDTGPNADDIDGSFLDVVQHIFGFDNENERTFVRGLPNSRGPSVSALEKALAGAPETGCFVVGMHNPPLNPSGNEFAHFFRESERQATEPGVLSKLMRAFVSRQQGPFEVVIGDWETKPTPHFKHGTIGDLLDFGVATWPDGVNLLDLLVNPKVDLVLCGHVHERVEFRLERQEGGGFRFLTDFYTENPMHHRESYDWRWADPPEEEGQQVETFVRVGDRRPIQIVIAADAKAGEPVRTSREVHPDRTVEYRRRRVPPNRNTLDRANHKRVWWNQHRPLIIQTACVGPIDYEQNIAADKKPKETFQGIRAVHVKRDHIALIRDVSIEQVRLKRAPAGFVSTHAPVVEPVSS